MAETEFADAGGALYAPGSKRDNPGAIALYKRLGYRQFGSYRDYYEDSRVNASAFERRILFLTSPHAQFPPVPITADHRIYLWPGPLIMVDGGAEPTAVTNDPGKNSKIWREATTDFMLSGHGAAAHGLGTSGLQRGFEATAWISNGRRTV